MHLILSQKGTELSLHQGTFLVQNQQGTHKLSPENIQSIMLSTGIRVSSNAMFLAIDREIDILLVDEAGQPQGRIWSHKFGSIASLRRQQLTFATSPKASRWLIDLLARQGKNRIALLTQLGSEKEEILPPQILELQKQVTHISTFPEQVPDHPFFNKLRSWEARHARLYFRCLSALMPKPFQFSRRSRRPAKDCFNSALNYLYGMLYAKVELALIRAGLDPFLGVFHRDQYNRPSLVFDQIECYRPWAEEVLAQVCLSGKLTPSCFQAHKGGYWLNAQGKEVVITAMHAFLLAPASRNGAGISREAKLLRDAQQLARWVERG